MSENIQRNRGRSKNYKFDRGGNPTEFGPFIGEVKNNVDNIRSGRLQVYIEQFGGENPDDESLWRTVNYIPPFYGAVLQTGTDTGAGTFVGNPQSYGMWFTPPDIGTQVICFFVAGDPNQGYYLGCVPDTGLAHMIPAIGASKNFDPQNADQKEYFKNATQLPVTEINSENEEIDDNPQFFNQIKPVHSYLAGVMLQQGIITDTERGPITSNSQRESPSAVFGISTPGRPVYQGGDDDKQIKKTVENKDSKLESVKVVARRGGHTLVMDDGDLEGNDNLVRIRSSKGHQITMSDDGNFFYIIHANGQTWVELGAEGTIDLFSTNSVNVRSQGEINLHADKNINMYAGDSINIKSKNVRINSVESLDLTSKSKISMYSESSIGLIASGSLGIQRWHNQSQRSWSRRCIADKASPVGRYRTARCGLG
jgi:phage baseplate assembly protein gpV